MQFPVINNQAWIEVLDVAEPDTKQVTYRLVVDNRRPNETILYPKTMSYCIRPAVQDLICDLGKFKYFIIAEWVLLFWFCLMFCVFSILICLPFRKGPGMLSKLGCLSQQDYCKQMVLTEISKLNMFLSPLNCSKNPNQLKQFLSWTLLGTWMYFNPLYSKFCHLKYRYR